MARPGISTKNAEKKPFGPKFWTPRIYPQNTPKIPKKYPQNTKNAHFWYFFGIFGVFSWGSRISVRGVFFRYFSWKFRVGPSRGSVAGRGVLNHKTPPQKKVWNPPTYLSTPCHLPCRKWASTRPIPLSEASKSGFGGHVLPPPIIRFAPPLAIAQFQPSPRVSPSPGF